MEQELSVERRPNTIFLRPLFRFIRTNTNHYLEAAMRYLWQNHCDATDGADLPRATLSGPEVGTE